MKIGGLQKLSLIDYPGHVGAVLFTQGCNFRCPYCHNPELVDPARFQEPLHKSAVFAFLEKRRGLLDAVTVTGGEPTLHGDLPDFLQSIKNMGFLVKLDTNGSNPSMLETCMEGGLVDYVAMDIKSPMGKYSLCAGVNADTTEILKTIRMIKASQVAHEFRTTLVSPLLTEEDVVSIGSVVGERQKYCLQKYVSGDTLEADFKEGKFFTEDVLKRISAELLEKYLINGEIR